MKVFGVSLRKSKAFKLERASTHVEIAKRPPVVIELFAQVTLEVELQLLMLVFWCGLK